MKITVYSADDKASFFTELKNVIINIKKSNFLSFQMAKRDLVAQYRQSFLGFVWAFAPIISTSVVWIFLRGSGAINLDTTDIPYPLFVIIGTALWSIFIECLQNPINSINSNRAILSKINFPKEALLISGIYKTLFNLFLKLIMVALFIFIYGAYPNVSISYFLLYLGTIIMFATALGVILAPIGLLYSDIGRIINMASSFLMYATPVVFLVPKSGVFKYVFEVNPLTYLIMDGRNSLVGLELEHIPFTLQLLVASFLLLLIALVFFKKSMPILIEKIS